MEDAAGINRPTWQWSGDAANVPSQQAPGTAASSSTGNEQYAETKDGIPRARTTRRKSDEDEDGPATATTPGAFEDEEEPEEPAMPAENAVPPRHYRPRKCRICLEVVLPTVRPPPEGVSAFFSPPPVVEYISEEPELGRLIRPCNCRGSMKWIHEGCLMEWRRQDPGSPNFWECPTCKFKYRLQRMHWSRMVRGKPAQMLATILVLFVTVFILGFVADPIINLYLDPWDSITTGAITEPILEDGGTWLEHLLKGLASLGLLGTVKALLAVGPWNYFNLRNTGVFGIGRQGRAANGRDRMASISWWLVALGVITFLYTVYKFVKIWSERILLRAGERVVDVQGNNDDDDADDDDE